MQLLILSSRYGASIVLLLAGLCQHFVSLVEARFLSRGYLLQHEGRLQHVDETNRQRTKTTANYKANRHAASASDTRSTAVLLMKNATSGGATATNSTVSDVPSLTVISASLDVLEKKMAGFNLQMDGIAQNLTAVENSTTSGLLELGNLQQQLRQIATSASNSSGQILQLQSAAQLAEQKLVNNTGKLSQEETLLSKLAEDVLQLSGSSLDTGRRVADLEKAVNETVPTGKLTQSMNLVEQRLTGFEAALKQGIEKQADQFLKTAIEQMRTQIQKAASAAASSTTTSL
ncbi:unnamed protein product [Amoebophrya sp. A120]|nr:unnamed protein product [Amoebophrya sp. A120]|eukprot:GSA120T00001023001.1